MALLSFENVKRYMSADYFLLCSLLEGLNVFVLTGTANAHSEIIFG